MSRLLVASKANQSSTLPALLVAHYVNHIDPNSHIGVDIEDTDGTVILEDTDASNIEGAARIIQHCVQKYKALHTGPGTACKLYISRWPHS